MGRPRGSEPPTSGTTNQRSNQLSYDRHSATKAGAILKGCSRPASSLVEECPMGDRPFEDSPLYSGVGNAPHHPLFLEAEPAETLVKLRNAAAGIQHTARTTGPCGVRGRINVERQRVAFLAPGGASFEDSAVGHLHFDHVISGVNIGFHV